LAWNWKMAHPAMAIRDAASTVNTTYFFIKKASLRGLGCVLEKHIFLPITLIVLHK